jgi:dihydrofolate synthase/folylpolyglutamate synthase
VRFTDLDGWLRWQETLHPRTIELGLERVGSVRARLSPLSDATRVVTVAGTNGKGSCVAVMAAVLAAAGRRVVAYTSPHLQRYNERIRIDGTPVADGPLIEAFAAIDAARGEIPLTYFEFGTLAALEVAAGSAPDVLLLEVGLGGRLDAVNIVDPEVAVITTVGLDHQDWLGPDRESIGAEKAGILRPGVPLVAGEADPPASVLARADALGCPLARLGREFRVDVAGRSWRFEGSIRSVADIPAAALPGPLIGNAAVGIEALDRLFNADPVPASAVRQGCGVPGLAGRFQRVDGPVDWLVDVAHNAPAARALADYARTLPPTRRTHCVIGLYAEKDAAAIVAELADVVTDWWCVDTRGERARPAAALAEIVRASGGSVRAESNGVGAVIPQVRNAARAGDRVLVLGSFTIVGPALEALRPAAP